VRMVAWQGPQSRVTIVSPRLTAVPCPNTADEIQRDAALATASVSAIILI
jgi:hypothetical protein